MGQGCSRQGWVLGRAWPLCLPVFSSFFMDSSLTLHRWPQGGGEVVMEWMGGGERWGEIGRCWGAGSGLDQGETDEVIQVLNLYLNK